MRIGKKYKYGRNKFEDDTYRLLRKKRISFKYETEKIPYILARHYVPDFIITTLTGKIYIETKGHLRREDKAKLVAIKRANPAMDLRILFYAPKKDQIRWAERNGFTFACGTIPEEWFHGF